MHYILKKEKNNYYYDDLLLLKDPTDLKSLYHPIRLKIIKQLLKEPMYAAELAKKLKIHEQKIYYHINIMQNSGILNVVERKEIRGTIATSYALKSSTIGVKLENDWNPVKELFDKKKETTDSVFFKKFIKNNKFDGKIVVGNPDPHGPFKARARDGHYAIDFALHLGSICNVSKNFSTVLDVDINLKKENSNLIVVGGPVTNLIMSEVNKHLPAKFLEEKGWGIKGKHSYNDDNIGIIAKIPHPYFEKKEIIAIAGIRFTGTKAAVIGLTRFSNLILNNYTKQKKFYAIVQGFDLDGDGKIDSVELLE